MPDRATADTPSTLLAFDFGLKRTGVASGNTVTRSAQPLRTIAVEGDARFVKIAELIAEWQPSALVVGVPRHPDGAEHDMTHRARRFARQLHGRFHLPVHEVDERYSTAEAVANLRSAAGASGGAKDADAEAAAILLNQYLSEAAESSSRQ